MDDTPRTDNEARKIWSEGNAGMGEDYAEEVVDASFARELERENIKMREALEFYADAANWKDKETGIGCYPGDAIDYGAKARAALG